MPKMLDHFYGGNQQPLTGQLNRPGEPSVTNPVGFPSPYGLIITKMLDDILRGPTGPTGPSGPEGSSGTGGTLSGTVRTFVGPIDLYGPTANALLSGDCIMLCDTTNGPVSLFFEPVMPDGQFIIIKDVAGNAPVNPIYVYTDFPDYLDGTTLYTIDKSYGSVLIGAQPVFGSSQNDFGVWSEYLPGGGGAGNGPTGAPGPTGPAGATSGIIGPTGPTGSVVGLHTQNTDTGTTSASFWLNLNLSTCSNKELSGSCNTTGTEWAELLYVQLIQYNIVSYSFLVCAKDTVLQKGGAFTVTGVCKVGATPDTIAYIENPPTVTRVGSDYANCSYLQVQVVHDTANGALSLQVKSISTNLTRWSFIGEIVTMS